MSPQEVLTLYRRRWQIECFFRWLKCLLGRRPSQRLWERLQLYLMGWATLDEPMQAVQAALENTGLKKS